MSIELMRHWLDALESVKIEFDFHGNPVDEDAKKIGPAITSLHQAIKEAEKQEPVAVVQDLDEVKRKHLVYECGFDWKDPLYTHPQPKRELVGLTEDEIALLCGECAASAHNWNDISFARAIEAKLKEKNT